MAEAVALLTEAEAAARLRVCGRTLRKMRQAGEIAYIRPPRSRCIRYHPDDLQAFIESARICQSESAPALRSTNTHSASAVVDFEAARARRKSQGPKR